MKLAAQRRLFWYVVYHALYGVAFSLFTTDNEASTNHNLMQPTQDTQTGPKHMNIHEYQAKALLKSFGVSVSDGVPIMKADEAEAAAKSLPGPVWVVKSQIHAGGRGKGRVQGTWCRCSRWRAGCEID